MQSDKIDLGTSKSTLDLQVTLLYLSHIKEMDSWYFFSARNPIVLVLYDRQWCVINCCTFSYFVTPQYPAGVLHHNHQGTTAVLNLQDILTMPHPF